MRTAAISVFVLLLAAKARVATPASVDIPPWLTEASRLMIPAYSADTDAVVLLDEQNTVVDNEGVFMTTHRRAIRVLRPNASRDASLLACASTFDTKILSMTGWNVRPDLEPLKVSMKQALMSSMAPDILYMDAKGILLEVPQAGAGCVVGFEWQELRTPPSLEDDFEFQGRYPVLHALYSLKLAPGWNADYYWVNWPPLGAPTAPSSPLDQKFEIRDIPAIVEEPRMPAVRAVAGHLLVRPKPPRPDSRSFSGWPEMGAWYENLTREALRPDKNLSLRAAGLTAHAPDTVSKIRALAGFVQKEIRYVAIEIGIGGFKPHSAPSILKNGYGDCKDKATLLAALLQTQGIDSYYMLVNVERGVVTPESPVSLFSFNHVIVAIRLPDDVPESGLTALIKHPKLGRLLVFDPTSPYTPLGRIPYYLQANTVLLAAGGRGELISPQLPEPETNLLDRAGRFALKEDGTLDGEIMETRRGSLADSFRHALQTSTLADRVKLLETRLAYSLSSFVVDGIRIENLEENGRDLVVRYHLRLTHYAKAAGGLLIVRPRVVGSKAINLSSPGKGPRRYPIDLDIPLSERDDFIIELPEGLQPEELPAPAELNPGFASYKSRTETSGHTLVYRREYRVTQPILPPGQFNEAVKFELTVAADEQQSAVLKK